MLEFNLYAIIQPDIFNKIIRYSSKIKCVFFIKFLRILNADRSRYRNEFCKHIIINPHFLCDILNYFLQKQTTPEICFTNLCTRYIN